MTGFLKQKGGYQRLRVYKVTEIIYDLTYHFCNRYLRKGDRTIDQMIQAARSGKQNIAEGSMAATTSTKTEIHLTNVALANLALTLTMQASHLLKKLLESQQEMFLSEGGISEQMTRARLAARSKQ